MDNIAPVYALRVLRNAATTQPVSQISRARAKIHIAEGYLLGLPDRSLRIEARHLAAAILGAERSNRSRISLINVEIIGKLDLAGANIQIPVQFSMCKFDEPISLTSSNFHLLRLDGCQIANLDGRELVVAGSLVLSGSTVHGTVYLHNAQVGGDLELVECKIDARENPGFFVRQAEIGGSLNARRIQVIGQSQHPLVNLDSAKVNGVTSFDGARIKNSIGPLISANQINANGGASICGNFEGFCSVAEPAISLNGLVSGGLVIFRELTVWNDQGPAIRAIGMNISQNLVMNGKIDINGAGELGAIRLNQSIIEGMASFDDMKVVNLSGPAISIDGAKIGGGGQFKNMHLIASGQQGAIAFKSCVIGLQWEFTRLVVIVSGGPALTFDQTVVAASLHINDLKLKGSTSEALIRTAGARIEGQVTLSGQINNRYGSAVRADGMRVSGSLCVSRLRVWSSDPNAAISFASLQVEGQVEIYECKIRNMRGRGISFQSAKITNNLNISSTYIAGDFESLRLYGTQIRDSFVLVDSEVRAISPRQIAILMQATEIGGVLRIEVDKIAETRSSRTPVYIDFDELRYGSLPARGADPKKWLDLIRSNSRDYSPQPYEHLAEVYKRAGQREIAREVLVAQEVERSRQSLSCGAWLWNEIKGYVIGYGYRPMRALFFIFGAWLIALATIVTTGAALGVIDNQSTPAPMDCSVLGQISFSTEVAIPLIGTGFRLQNCGVDTTSAAGQWVLISLSGIRIIAWFFAALFVAGFTGLVKKD